MSSVFAFDDIVNLLATIPPPVDSETPVLLRSRSGDYLLDQSTVLKRCHDLIAQSEARISRGALAASLDIQANSLEQLESRFDGDTILSSDQQKLLPKQEIASLEEKVRSITNDGCFDVRTFARENDISAVSLERYLDRRLKDGKCAFTDDSGHLRYLSSNEHIEATRQDIRRIVNDASTTEKDLTELAPPLVLERLAPPILAELSLKLLSKAGRVEAVPEKDDTADDSGSTSAKLDKLASQLSTDRYCLVHSDIVVHVPESSLVDAKQQDDDQIQTILNQYEKLAQSEAKVQLLVKSATKASKPPQLILLIQTSFVNDIVASLEPLVANKVQQIWQSGERAITAAPVVAEAARSAHTLPRDAMDILLSSPQCSSLRDIVDRQTTAFVTAERAQVHDILTTKLIIPFQLYDSGIMSIQDETLKQHLEEHLLAHFRLEIIPPILQLLEQQHFLQDKARLREINKLKQSSQEARTWDALRSSFAKLSKKLDLAAVSIAEIDSARIRTLQSTVKSLPRMTRGSDVLQNLIWICLASRRKGLFMSSGKDTSRMIKAYESDGDADIAIKLRQWRDMLKAGTEKREDVQEMRELAMRVVEEQVTLTGPA